MPSREIEDFISRWSAASPSERANAQLFLVELCDLLGVLRPDPKPGSGYAFEFPVRQPPPFRMAASRLPRRQPPVPWKQAHA
jgi:hypothetical protein